MAKLKVFWTTDMAHFGAARYGHTQQIRIVVATTSKTKARELFSPNFKAYHSISDITETGNKDDIASAMAESGTVYWCPLDWYGPAITQKRTWRA